MAWPKSRGSVTPAPAAAIPMDPDTPAQRCERNGGWRGGGGIPVTRGHIYYLHREQQNGSTPRFSFAIGDGSDTAIGQIDKRLVSRLSLSRDGKYLIYSQVDQYGGDLLMAEKFR